jgi:enoyl-CoA hydratase/carnithine racemase
MTILIQAPNTAPTVHLERIDDGAIAVLTLDDSGRADAMSPQMGDVFTRHIRSIQDDPSLKAVVIRGAGKDFSIGGHRDMLIELGNGKRTEAELHDFMLKFYDRWLPVLDLPVPVIAAMQGDCIGVAPVFACVADVAYADETLNLQVTFAGLGFYPGMALPALLCRKIGPYRATLLTTSNEAISGKEAERLGLIERCVPAGAAYGEALKTARAIASSAPSVVRLLKRNLGIKKAELVAELEANAAQQAIDFHSDEYRKRIANYLPDHYA